MSANMYDAWDNGDRPAIRERIRKQDELFRMAQEVHLDWYGMQHHAGAFRLALERFAALVAAAEREACAKVVEGYTGAWDDQGYALAQAIRARGQE